MNRIAEFKKVSFDQFKEGVENNLGINNPEAIKIMYNNLKEPKRATSGSAGYDFFAPTGIYLNPGETKTIPTGWSAKIEAGWVLLAFPRSGLGFKYRLQLDNTIGVIDSDYIDSSNEGNILLKITNDSKNGKNINIQAGQGFAQGIFVPFGITHDDYVTEKRDGGFGSTTK